LLGLIPPKKTVWYKDGSTSWVPIDALLGEKKSKALESGRATIEASAPFIIRLEKMRQYPSTFSVEWYGVLPGMSEPVEVVLKFGEHNCGTELAGFRQDALYKGEWHERRGLPYAYVPRFPFVVDRTVYFYGGGLEHGARPTVAWWREELIDSELSVSENWLALTEPK
jgi:hypothetical protein